MDSDETIKARQIADSALKLIESQQSIEMQARNQFKKVKQSVAVDKFAVSQQLMARNNYITLIDTDEMLVYTDGVYQPYGDVHIKLECQKLLGQDTSLHIVSEVIGHIKRETYTDRDVLDGNIDLIAVKNGVLNIHTKELVPFNPSFYLTAKLPVFYRPGATCPECEKFFKDIVPAEDVPSIKEWIGYCLLKKYPVQKALMLLGAGHNGKSTLLKLLTAFLGKNNTSSELLQNLEDDKFSTARLFGKLANISADIPSTDMRTSSIFKMLVGGDTVPAQEKFSKAFYFVNHAKLIFSANRLPRTYDDSLAYFRRWHIITFPNSFEGAKDDKALIDRITSDDELCGLLNVALEGLQALLQSGEFTNATSAESMQDRYSRLSDSVYAFVQDCIDISPIGQVVKQVAFERFLSYCKENRLPVVTDKTFFSRMPRHCAVEDVKVTVDNKRLHCWNGIMFRKVEQ